MTVKTVSRRGPKPRLSDPLVNAGLIEDALRVIAASPVEMVLASQQIAMNPAVWDAVFAKHRPAEEVTRKMKDLLPNMGAEDVDAIVQRAKQDHEIRNGKHAAQGTTAKAKVETDDSTSDAPTANTVPGVQASTDQDDGDDATLPRSVLPNDETSSDALSVGTPVMPFGAKCTEPAEAQSSDTRIDVARLDFWTAMLERVELDGNVSSPTPTAQDHLVFAVAADVVVSCYYDPTKRQVEAFLHMSKESAAASIMAAGLLAEKAAISAEVGLPVQWTQGPEDDFILYAGHRFPETDAPDAMQRQAEWLASVVGRLIAVLRPRVFKLARELHSEMS